MLGVMARRADLAEGVGDAGARVHDGVDGAQSSANRPQRRFEGSRRHDRIAVEIYRHLAQFGRRGADAFEMSRAMGPQNRRLDIIPQRGLFPLETAEGGRRQHLVDGAHSSGPFRMAGPRPMEQEAGVRHKESAHRIMPAPTPFGVSWFFDARQAESASSTTRWQALPAGLAERIVGEEIVQTSRRLMKALDRDAAPFMGN
jgi:hypothetical protein